MPRVKVIRAPMNSPATAESRVAAAAESAVAADAEAAGAEEAGSRGAGPVLQALALNAVPLIGIWLAGWSTATTLALYWCESLMGALLVALRLVIHRRLTHARGYSRNQLGVTFTMTGSDGKPIEGFIPEFLAGSLVFSLAHGVALAFVLARLLPRAGAAPLDPMALEHGLLAIGLFQLIAFQADMPGLRHRPFAWARQLAELTIGRVMVMHLTIVAGIALLFWLRQAGIFIGLFAVLKTVLDLRTAFAGARLSRRVPRWLAWLAGQARPGADPQRLWETAVDREKALAATDEASDAPPRTD